MENIINQLSKENGAYTTDPLRTINSLKEEVENIEAELKAGVYFVKLNDNGRFVETQKLIIQ